MAELQTFRICEVIGCPDPDLLNDLRVSTLQKWNKYQEQTGFRDDIHWGLLLSLIYNVNRDENAEVMKPTEWMPYLVEQLPDKQELQERIKNNIATLKRKIEQQQQPNN